MTLEFTNVDIKSGKEKEKSLLLQKNYSSSKMNSMSVEEKENAFKNRKVLFPKIMILYKEKESSF